MWLMSVILQQNKHADRHILFVIRTYLLTYSLTYLLTYFME